MATPVLSTRMDIVLWTPVIWPVQAKAGAPTEASSDAPMTEDRDYFTIDSCHEDVPFSVELR